MQACKVCKETKALADFPVRTWKTKSGAIRRGHRKICYACQRNIDNANYNAPESTKRARRKLYNVTHAEQLATYRKTYYKQNKARWLDRETGWRFSTSAVTYDINYRKRPEVITAAQVRGKHWRQNNKAKLLAKTRLRQAHVIRATPAWADIEAIRAIYVTCEEITQQTGINHEVDHYFPLISNVVCGLHVEANLRIIPASEKRSKGNRMPEID